FFAERSADWLNHIAASPQVNVGVGSGGTWVSLTGHAAIVSDVAKKKDLWNSGVEAWLPQGPEDASVVLVKVDGDTAEYWDSPGNRLATAFSFIKAKATGDKPDTGENKVVDL
ncbi:MAG TPA: pyridoxamine 5'-phosphate oxidase family protein, partial [Geodermatophilus sp.]|nr:pyridoxamine 5'-phosphate oxidase family protein [Geodermatophilus sp.]